VRTAFWEVMVVAFACALGIGSAAAADSGFYLGAGAGQAKYEAREADIASPLVIATASPIPALSWPGLVPGSPFSGFLPPAIFVGVAPAAAFIPFRTSVDRSDTAWSLGGGYRLNRFVAFELAYADLGELSIQRRASSSSFQLRLDQRLETQAVSISAFGRWPLSERWTVYGRGGYEFVEVESRFDGASGAALVEDFDSNNFLLGVGVDYAISERWSARIDAQRHLSIGGDAFLNERDIDALSLSVILRL